MNGELFLLIIAHLIYLTVALFLGFLLIDVLISDWYLFKLMLYPA